MAVATIGGLDLESAAKEAAENWQHFDCFSWHRASDLADADFHKTRSSNDWKGN
jgi:hypothetical protein